MSDKFFFKGRQDARQSYIKYGSNKKTNAKAGSEKYPLKLVVTSEARKTELEAMVAAANLCAVITVNSKEGAVESIAELSALLNRATAVKVEKTPSRNEPCTCGSEKKYKKCCGAKAA